MFRIQASEVKPMEVNILSAMIGHTMVSILDGESLDGGMLFTSTDGTTFRFYHSQRCCESVGIEDIIGDVQDLLLGPLLSWPKRFPQTKSSHANVRTI